MQEFYLLHLYLFSQRECERKTSHSLDIRILISLVKFDIFDASISSEKYLRISLNLASEILERTIYLFFNFATLVTFQEHSFHRNLLLLCVSLS